MKVLLCGYRDWALDVFKQLEEHHAWNVQYQVVQNPTSLTYAMQNISFDVAFVVGWSWKIDAEHLARVPFIGMHPSDLPAYAGGSPIQNQILDGLTLSKATLFRLSPEMDAGPIIDKREYSLEGHLDEVLARIAASTFVMICNVLDKWPKLVELPQDGSKDVRKRIRSSASHISKAQFHYMSCRQLWDAIRCREDPYPNVFLEDDTGTLIIKRVEFVPK